MWPKSEVAKHARFDAGGVERPSLFGWELREKRVFGVDFVSCYFDESDAEWIRSKKMNLRVSSQLLGCLQHKTRHSVDTRASVIDCGRDIDPNGCMRHRPESTGEQRHTSWRTVMRLCAARRSMCRFSCCPVRDIDCHPSTDGGEWIYSSPKRLCRGTGTPVVGYVFRFPTLDGYLGPFPRLFLFVSNTFHSLVFLGALCHQKCGGKNVVRDLLRPPGPDPDVTISDDRRQTATLHCSSEAIFELTRTENLAPAECRNRVCSRPVTSKAITFRALHKDAALQFGTNFGGRIPMLQMRCRAASRRHPACPE